ncbi:MAG: response regulator [Pyrinomonadaceae bacterium]
MLCVTDAPRGATISPNLLPSAPFSRHVVAVAPREATPLHPEELAEATDAQAEPGRKPRALVVDDAPDVTEMMAILLQYAGYDVVTVFSAQQALEAVGAEQFDVMISDIGMPGMNGYELAEAVRQMPDYQATPMIAVTGFTIYDDRERALKSGFNAFLTKPINPKDLINLVKSLSA